jgi:hypothetical protein
VRISLLGEAVYLMKDEIVKTVHGVGFAPMAELLEKTIAAEIPIHACLRRLLSRPWGDRSRFQGQERGVHRSNWIRGDGGIA